MTKVKCANEDIWGKCKHSENGVCMAEEVELVYTMDSSSERCTTGHMKCDSEAQVRLSVQTAIEEVD